MQKNKEAYTIPDGVTTICFYAFKFNNNNEITIPDSVTTVEGSAFKYCSSLKTVHGGKNIVNYESSSFDDTEWYKNSPVLVLGTTLLRFDSMDENVVVPEGIEVIGPKAFSSSGGKNVIMETVTLPSSLREIGESAFSYKKNLKAISFPEGLQTIGKGAFRGCQSLTEVVFPESISEIGVEAFQGCSSVSKVVLPHTVSGTMLDNILHNEADNGIISAGAFSSCTSLEHIEIPEGTVAIGASAFNNCSSLKSIRIPTTVKIIEKEAFANCFELEELFLPASCVEIGQGVLPHATTEWGARSAKFSRIDVDPQNEAFSSVDGILCSKNGETIIACPSQYNVVDYTVPDGVKEILPGAFEGCEKIKRVVFAKTVEKIGAKAFASMAALEEIVLPPDCPVLGDGLFMECANLKFITWPNNVREIGAKCFAHTGIENLAIPETVESVGKYSFSFIKAKRARLPKTVKDISLSVFAGVPEIEVYDTIDSEAKPAAEYLDDMNGGFNGKVGFIGIHQKENYLVAACNANWYEHTIIVRSTEDDSEKFRVRMPNGQKRKVYCTFASSWGKNAEFNFNAVDNIFKDLTADAKLDYALNRLRCQTGVSEDMLSTLSKYVARNAKEIASRVFVTDSVEDLVLLESFGIVKKNTIDERIDAATKANATKCIAWLLNWQNSNISTKEKAAKAEKKLSAGALTVAEIKKIWPNKKSADGGLTITGYNGKDVDARVPEIIGKTPVTAIADNCFGDNKDNDQKEFLRTQLRSIEIPDSVTTISTHAFIDCNALKRVVIPETVSDIGDEVFPRIDWNPSNKLKLTDIEVSPKAGAKSVGSEVFAFPFGDEPLTYPKLPVTFVKEATTQVRLGMGFCQHPEKFEGDYAEIYKKYVASHEKTIVKKAKQLKLTDVEAYYSALSSDNVGAKAAFKPNVSAKKLSDLAKVELLEDTIQKGTVEDVKLVLETYKSFEMMSRALGLAARYKGLAFVKELVNAGATFNYEFSTTLQRKYKMNQDTAAGSYRTEYYLMLVPEKIDFKVDKWGCSKYAYTPLCGVPAMNIPDELENNVLSIEERFEIAKFCSENKKLNVSLDEMLFWALTRSELKFADLLMEYGVDLKTTAPNYYTTWGSPGTYMDIITSGSSSVYWNEYVYRLTQLKATEVAPVLERLTKLATAADKKLVISQKMFDEMNWNDKSLAFALENIDFAKINQKKAMELAVDKNFIASLEIMSQAGWLSTTAKREKLIEFARTNKKKEALAWLMDFKNRTVDVQAEAAKEEAKLIKELTEDPNSVSALKKVWSYKKLDDGTLIITSYKGDAIDVEVPAVIGKAPVTVIGEDSFSASDWNSRIKNQAERKKIKSITIPEGVVEIQKSAFWSLDELEKLTLPSTVKKIGTALAGDCKKLKEVNIPTGAKLVGDGILFIRCNELHDQNGCIIINNCLYTHTEHNGWAHGFGVKSDIGNIEIPDNVTEIAAHVFLDGRMSSLTLPNGLKVIGEKAFEKCSFLGEVTIPGSVESIKSGAFIKCSALKTVKLESGVAAIGAEAFASCNNLRDVYIPKSVKKLGKEIFGAYDDNANSWSKVTGICVHTQEDSPAVEYMKKYSGVYVVFDYDE